MLQSFFLGSSWHFTQKKLSFANSAPDADSIRVFLYAGISLYMLSVHSHAHWFICLSSQWITSAKSHSHFSLTLTHFKQKLCFTPSDFFTQFYLTYDAPTNSRIPSSSLSTHHTITLSLLHSPSFHLFTSSPTQHEVIFTASLTLLLCYKSAVENWFLKKYYWTIELVISRLAL